MSQPVLPLLLGLLACARPPDCADDETRADGACLAYTAGDPVAFDGERLEPGLAWQIQYTGELDTDIDVDVFDLDLFDTPDTNLLNLQDRGVATLCYFSAGSYEDWRPDADEFPDEALGRAMDGWPGEWWVDITNSAVRAIMTARLDRAVERGCTAVDPDNVNGYQNPTGLNLNATMQLDYNRFLADEAHKRGLSIGLKNDIDQLDTLEPWFDWALNEECATYEECDGYDVYTGNQKAVFHVEYAEDWDGAQAEADQVCGVGPGLDTLVKLLELGSERLACPE